MMMSMLLLATATATAAPALAEADSAVQLGITPVGSEGSWFELESRPGQRIDLDVDLANHGTAPVLAEVYVADVYSLLNGGMGVALAEEEATNPATGWIDFPDSTLTLQPDRALRRSFSVSVPDDAAPGQYIAALVLEHQTGTSQNGNVGIEQVSRQAIAVNITVPGPATPGLAIAGSSLHRSGGHAVVRTTVHNTGNRHLSPAGTTTITTTDGATVATQDHAMGTLHAGRTTHIETPVPIDLPPGTYTVTTTLADDSHNVDAAHTSSLDVPAATDTPPDRSSAVPGLDQIARTLDQTPSPALLIGLLATIAALLVAVLTVLITRRRRPEPAATRPSPPEPAADAATSPTAVVRPHSHLAAPPVRGEPAARPTPADSRLFTAHSATEPRRRRLARHG